MTDSLSSMTIGHVAMNTPDLDRSREFFEDVLGWRTILVDHPRGAPFRRLASLVAPSGTGPVLLLFEVPGYESGVADDIIGRRGRIDHVAFRVDDADEFDDTVRRLIAAGSTSGHVDELGPTRSVLFVDPHGGHHNLQTPIVGWQPDSTVEVLDAELLARRFGTNRVA